MFFDSWRGGTKSGGERRKLRDIFVRRSCEGKEPSDREYIASSPALQGVSWSFQTDEPAERRGIALVCSVKKAILTIGAILENECRKRLF